MGELKIELKDGYKALKEIYYQNGSGNFLKWNGRNGPSFVNSFFVVLSMIFFLVALQSPKPFWIVLTILSFLLAIFAAIFLAVRARKYIVWKNSVEKYLTEVKKYDSQWLTLNLHTLQLSNSDETIIEKWENVKKIRGR